MKYYFFLDETGDHGLNYVDKNFPLLCGCLLREDRLNSITRKINSFKQKFFKTENVILHSKRENIVGLQIADLCTYPLARNLLNPTEPYVPFQVIKEKIYCNQKGEYEGWGLKVFP